MLSDKFSVNRDVFRPLRDFYIKYILSPSNSNVLVLFLMVVDLWWAFVLIASPDLFQTAQSFKLINNLAPQWVFSAVCTINGLVLFQANRFAWYRALKIICMTNMVFWFFVTYIITLATPLTTGNGIYFAVAIVGGVIYLRVKGHE